MQVFFKEILLGGPLGKTSYNVYRVEFQYRGSSYIHSLLWIQKAPKLTPDTEEYIKFVEKFLSAKLQLSKLCELVKAYQIHTHSRTYRKYKKKGCRFNYGRFCSERIIPAKSLPHTLEITPKKIKL